MAAAVATPWEIVATADDSRHRLGSSIAPMPS
jgi:hypothetical protein